MIQRNPPLPFLGNKKRYFSQIRDIIFNNPGFRKIKTVVDVFGGSGLLSHWAARLTPCEVIYNDFDYFVERYEHYDETRELLLFLKKKYENVPKSAAGKVADCYAKQIGEDIAAWPGYVDCITLSSKLLYSGREAKTPDGFKNKSTWWRMYNGLPEKPLGYFDNMTIIHKDYREVFDYYKDRDDVFWFVDPPYTSRSRKVLKNGYKSGLKPNENSDIVRFLKERNFAYFCQNEDDFEHFLSDTRVVPLCSHKLAVTGGTMIDRMLYHFT